MPKPIIEAPLTNIEKSGTAVSEHSSRSDHVHPAEGRSGTQFRNGNGHRLPHNTLIGRSNNAGNSPLNHNFYLGRRDSNHYLNHEWSFQGFYGGGSVHVQPQRLRVVPGPFIPTPHPRPLPPPRPPIGPNPFSPFPMPMVGLFCNPIVLPATFNGIPFRPPPIPRSPPLPTDPQLHANIVKQIEYYFSKENLVKDTFLREKMDDQGWVPVRVIANFNRVKLLTNSIPLILRVLRTNSTVVEVQGNRVRRRDDWSRWLLPPPVRTGLISYS